MPLHVARLRDSDLAAEESPEACWYAVLLWAASWHQIPAGSLPNNDAVLTRLIGLGRDVKTFAEHKDAAMRGFVLCDDGRLYHPVVAEQVIVAWQGKLQQRWRTECARIKKRNQRDKTEVAMPTFDEFIGRCPDGVLAPCPEFVPEDVPRDNAECPQGKHIQEKGTGTGNIIEPPNPPSRGASDEEFERVWLTYPERGRATCAKSLARQRVDEALADGCDPSQMLAGAGLAAKHAADGGRPKRFDRWVAERLFLNAAAPPSPGPACWIGPPSLWAAAVASLGEPLARSYLAPCAIDGSALIPKTRTAMTELERAIGREIRAAGLRITEPRSPAPSPQEQAA